MGDRLHEIIAQIAVIHKDLINDEKIDDVEYVLAYIESYEKDVQEHYLKLLLQYYFQQNSIENFKYVLLLGYKFDLRMDDIKQAFFHISSNDENVIELLEDNVVFFKDTNYEEPLNDMYEYYEEANDELRVILEETIELIKRNRYVCAYCYKNQDKDFAKFFLNEDLLASLKRDLPYLLK
jgi:hypothetical protein